MVVRAFVPDRFAVCVCIASFGCSLDNESARSQENGATGDGDGDGEASDPGASADDEACKGSLDDFCVGTDCPSYEEVASFVYDRIYYCTEGFDLHVSRCGDYVEVRFGGLLYGVHYYFDSTYALVGAMPYSDINEFCGGREHRGEFGMIPRCPDVEDPCAQFEGSEVGSNSLSAYCSTETCPTYDELAETLSESACSPENRFGSCGEFRLVEQQAAENQRAVWYFDAGKILMGVRTFSPTDSASDSTDYGSIPACAAWDLEPECTPDGRGGSGG